MSATAATHEIRRQTGPATASSLERAGRGRKIAFMTKRDEHIEAYVIDADGGNPANLTNHPGSDTAAIWVPLTRE